MTVVTGDLGRALTELGFDDDVVGWLETPAAFSFARWGAGAVDTGPTGVDPRTAYAARFWDGDRELRWSLGPSPHAVLVERSGHAGSLRSPRLLWGTSVGGGNGWTRLHEDRVADLWVPIEVSEGERAHLLVDELVHEVGDGPAAGTCIVIDEIVVGVRAGNPNTAQPRPTWSQP